MTATEIGLTVPERTEQLQALLSRRAFFDGLGRIIEHTLKTDAEAGFSVTHAAGRYRSHFVIPDPESIRQVLATSDMPESEVFDLTYSSLNMTSAVRDPNGMFRPGLMAVVHTHPVLRGMAMRDALLPSTTYLDGGSQVLLARPDAIEVIAAANEDTRRAFMYCRSTTQPHVPRYQQLEEPGYNDNALRRVLNDSGINHAYVDFGSFGAYRDSLNAAVPALAS